MLKWYEENGKHLGFDDGTYVYRVAEDENGWYYEHIMTQDGFDGYETAEEAMEAAEADFSAHQIEIELDDLEPLSLEEMEAFWDTYWDEIAHERMENAMGLF